MPSAAIARPFDSWLKSSLTTCNRAPNSPSIRVGPVQATQAEPAEHLVDRRRGDTESAADARRPELLPPAQTLNPALEARSGAAWAPHGQARAIEQPRSPRAAVAFTSGSQSDG